MRDIPIMLSESCCEKAVSNGMAHFIKPTGWVLGKALFITELVKEFEILQNVSLLLQEIDKEHILEHTT